MTGHMTADMTGHMAGDMTGDMTCIHCNHDIPTSISVQNQSSSLRRQCFCMIVMWTMQ